MKILHIIFMPILIYVSFVIFSMPVHAEFNDIISVEHIDIDAEQVDTTRIPLSNTPIELIGPEQEKTFFYEVLSTPTNDQNELVLSMTHSNLLIAPSAITVSIDDEPVLSTPIHNTETVNEVTVPLTGDALTKGFHSVKVSFYGIVKEGICVEQGMPGNWISLAIDSYIQLSGQQSEKTLEDYPQQFIGTDKHPTAIIIPDDATIETLDSSMKVASHIDRLSEGDEAVEIIRESDVQTIKGNIILIGAISEFQTSFVKNIVNEANIKTEQDALLLSRLTITNENKEADVLFVTGDTPESINNRIEVLTDNRYIEQLSDKQMVIQSIPETFENENDHIVPLRRLGFSHFTLDRFEPETEKTFYYVPTKIDENGTVLLTLHVKQSETIHSAIDQKETDPIIDNDVELIVFINDVPHSIHMNTLTGKENGIYTIEVPIDASIISDNRLMNIQFQATGLHRKNPCFNDDQNRWIYIMEDSFFTFPTKDDEDYNHTFSSFPSPFIDEIEETIVVLSSEEKISDEQLFSLYKHVTRNTAGPAWTLAWADDLSEEDIQQNHILFIGGPSVHPLLQGQADQLTVAYENNVPMLTSFGFLQESVEYISWIQTSPWNENRSMLIFDHIQAAESYVDEDLLLFLMDTDDKATVAVKMKNNQLYTNALQLEQQNLSDGLEDDDDSAIPVWAIIGFAILILFTIAAIIIVLRKQRRKVD